MPDHLHSRLRHAADLLQLDAWQFQGAVGYSADDPGDQQVYDGYVDAIAAVSEASGALASFKDVTRQWLRGCSCAPPGRPWECVPCTEAFAAAIRKLIEKT